MIRISRRGRTGVDGWMDGLGGEQVNVATIIQEPTIIILYC